jgi:hypothetical protein
MRKKPHTHTAWGVMQLGRRHRDTREIGTGTIDIETNTAVVYTDRIMRRDTGMILLVPHDIDPPDLSKPQRPDDDGEAQGDEDVAGD